MTRPYALICTAAAVLDAPCQVYGFAPQQIFGCEARQQSRRAVRMAAKAGVQSNPTVALGGSDLRITRSGLGALNFGAKISAQQAAQLLDVAFDEYGVNWVDTSETYPKPIDDVSEFGAADRAIAPWLKHRDRSKVILSSQIAGRSNYMNWMRKSGETTALTAAQIKEAVDASLQRLGTDYIDLLQIEWPDRYVGYLGDDYYKYENEFEQESEDFEAQLMALESLITAGKVRYTGVGNETPFGISKFAEHAEWDELPKIVSCQSAYNLLQRNKVENGLVETCAPRNCNVSIIATTALGGGALSGKYIRQTPATADREARLNRYSGFQSRFLNPQCVRATIRYKQIAEEHGMSLAHMSLAWVATQPFIASTLVGAANEAQLRENLEAVNSELPAEVLAQVQTVFNEFREPVLGRYGG